MPVTAGNPLLQMLRIAAAQQQIAVVIAFDDQPVESRQHGFDMRGGCAGIGQHTKARHAVAKHKLRRFACVMRHRVGKNFDVTHRKRRVTVDDDHFRECAAGGNHRRMGAMGEINRDPEFTGKPRHAADMVIVLVGHEYRIQCVRLQPQPGQPAHRFSGTETTIQQHPCMAGFDHQRIALTAAAQ